MFEAPHAEYIVVPISHTVSDGSARSVMYTTSGPDNQFYWQYRQEHWSQPFFASANRTTFTTYSWSVLLNII